MCVGGRGKSVYANVRVFVFAHVWMWMFMRVRECALVCVSEPSSAPHLHELACRRRGPARSQGLEVKMFISIPTAFLTAALASAASRKEMPADGVYA